MPRKKSSNRRIRKRGSSSQQGLAAFVPDSAAGSLLHSSETSIRVLKFSVGLFLLPVTWIVLETFVILLKADTLGGNYWRTPEFLAFGAGGVLWMLLFWLARSGFVLWLTRGLMWLYVAGHELTHALFVLLCRGKVTKVHISSDGGHILTNRNNFLISLSPYFFPFYSVLAVICWALLQWVFRDRYELNPLWFYGALGFSWLFHLSFTLWMIRREQPDVDQNGKLFSFTVIFLVNLLLLCALLILASPTATFTGFGISLWENGRSFLDRLSESVIELFRALPF